MSSFSESLEAFRVASPWLASEHEPDLTALAFIANRLDSAEVANPAPLIAQWGLLLRGLRKQAPTADAHADDPLEVALRQAAIA